MANNGPDSSVASLNNLSYLNQNEASQMLYVRSTRAPTGSDRRYKIGTVWLDQTNDTAWILISVTSGQANWDQFTDASFSTLVTTPAATSVTYTSNTITATGSNTNIDIVFATKGNGQVLAERSYSGGIVAFTARNDATTANSSAAVGAIVAAGTSGPPYLFVDIVGVGGWHILANTSTVDGDLDFADESGVTYMRLLRDVGDLYIFQPSSGLRFDDTASNAVIGVKSLTAGVATVDAPAVYSTSYVFLTRVSKGSGSVGLLQVTSISDATSFVVTSLKSDGTTETTDNGSFNFVFFNPHQTPPL